jgi:hypothetical protein
MLGQFLVVATIGLVVWKYRDFLSEYVKGNAGTAREKVDGLPSRPSRFACWDASSRRAHENRSR